MQIELGVLIAAGFFFLFIAAGFLTSCLYNKVCRRFINSDTDTNGQVNNYYVTAFHSNFNTWPGCNNAQTIEMVQQPSVTEEGGSRNLQVVEAQGLPNGGGSSRRLIETDPPAYEPPPSYSSLFINTDTVESTADLT